MDEMNLKQLTLAVRTIAEEKNLPEETVLSVIEQAIAAAWRRDNGERDQEVRAELNVNDGTAVVYVAREVVEAVGSDAHEISLEDARKVKKDAELGDMIEDAGARPPSKTPGGSETGPRQNRPCRKSRAYRHSRV